ncbi:MAG: alpha/beta fold hydrolase [Bacteroidales bacterium]|nr:alpha/beta fold hydrolase [Bacteroidales bacterium]
MYYRRLGEGTPLMILHGLYGSSDNWLTIARQLSAQYDVIIPDLRNHGHSPHHHVHTYGQMSTDVIELMDTLHIDRCILMGHSMGGKTAMHIAAQTPERLEKLVVVDIAPVNYSSLTEFSDIAVEHLNMAYTLLNTDLGSFAQREDIASYWADKIPDANTRQFLLKNLQRKDKSFEWRIHIQAITQYLPHILNGMDTFLSDKHPVIHVPTLFVKGEISNYLQPEIFSPVKIVFPHSQTAVIPDAGHWLHVEQPEKFMKTIRIFFEK